MFPINSDTNLLEDYNYVQDMIDRNKMNQFIIEKIEAINDLDDLDVLSDEGYMERYYSLLKLAGHKKQKVWGEYDWVSSNATIPVLFSKATSIPLSRNEVINLLDDLAKKYKTQLLRNVGSERIKREGNLVPLRFSDDIGAHYNPEYTEIKFYKYGDWRFGYHGVFCAETVFHEFAHLLDSNRVKYANIDAHDDMFVRLLEDVLYNYSGWINDRYKKNNHINQILMNSNLMMVWSSSKNEFIKKEVEKKSNLKKEFESIKKEEAKKLGLTENEYPLRLILKDEEETILKIMYDVLTKYKEYGVSLPLINKTRKIIKDNGIDSVLNKEQINILSDAVNYVNMKDMMPDDLSMLDSNKLRRVLSSFEVDLDAMKRGVLDADFGRNRRIQQS